MVNIRGRGRMGGKCDDFSYQIFLILDGLVSYKIWRNPSLQFPPVHFTCLHFLSKWRNAHPAISLIFLLFKQHQESLCLYIQTLNFCIPDTCCKCFYIIVILKLLAWRFFLVNIFSTSLHMLYALATLLVHNPKYLDQRLHCRL